MIGLTSAFGAAGVPFAATPFIASWNPSAKAKAVGAAFMAGLQIGVYKSLKDISKNWQADKSFKPRIKNSERKILIDGWRKAIKKTLS